MSAGMNTLTLVLPLVNAGVCLFCIKDRAWKLFWANLLAGLVLAAV